MNTKEITKLILIPLVIWGILSSELRAQISISISTDREKYVQYEPIELRISIKNNSGHVLNFSGKSSNQGYLGFHVKNQKGSLVAPITEDLNPVENLVLSSGVIKTIQLKISNYFNFQEEDNFELKVRVGHQRFRDDFLSNPVYFQVRPGTVVWKREVGLPDFSKEARIATRSCSLNIFNEVKGEIYFLQVEDEQYVYSVIRLGPRVRGIKPQCEVDALSQIHTLIQTAPRLFHYRIIDLLGESKHSTFYLINNIGPNLVYDSEVGSVTVVGGKKAVEGVDFVAEKNAESSTSGGSNEIIGTGNSN